MPRILIVIEPKDSTLADEVRSRVSLHGGRILHSYGPAVLVVDGPSDLMASLAERQENVHAYTGRIEDEFPDLDTTGRMGIAAWNESQSSAFREARRNRRGEGLPWDSEDEPSQ